MDGVLETAEKRKRTLHTVLANISGQAVPIGEVHHRIDAGLESDRLAYSGVVGSLDDYMKGKTEKAFYDFEGELDLADGASVVFDIWVSPDPNADTGNGKKAGHQEYTSTGEHCLNSDAWFEGWIGDEYVEGSTEPVCVEVLEAD